MFNCRKKFKCVGERTCISELTDDVSLIVGLGGPTVAEQFDKCPFMGRSEKWLMKQWIPSLDDTSKIYEGLRKDYGPSGQHWRHLKSSCSYPKHEELKTKKRKSNSKASLKKLSMSNIKKIELICQIKQTYIVHIIGKIIIIKFE